MEPKQKIEFSSVDEYIALQTEQSRAGLEQIRKTIKNTALGAEEVISYGMPAFKLHGILIWYAAFKDHYGIYPYPETIKVFKEKLTSYALSKGTIKFPLNKPLPLKLLSEIVGFRVKEDLRKQSIKELAKSRK